MAKPVPEITDDLPVEFDPEIAMAALGSILSALRISYGLRRLGVNATRDGSFLAEVWWDDGNCASARGDDANAAVRAACAKVIIARSHNR